MPNMRRAIGLAVMLGTTATASAESIEIPRYANRAEAGSLVRIELLAESARTHISSSWVDHDRGDVVLSHDGDAVTRGASGRFLFGNANVYVGAELGIGKIISAPPFRDGSSFRTTTPTPDAAFASTGYSLTLAAPLGIQSRAGRLLVGLEALVGWRRMVLDSPSHAANLDGFVPLFETRARAGVWITPAVSVSAVAGLGVVVNDSRSLCLVLAVSRTPFDGARR